MLNYRIKILSSFVILSIVSLFVNTGYQQNFRTLAQTIPLENPIEQVTWSSISDDYYGYDFQVPSTWYMEMGVTPDRWHFFSDPAVASDGSTHPTDIPNGLIKIDFGVETVANLLPEPKVRNPFVDELGQADRDDLIPLLPPGTWTTVGDMPALLLPANEKMLTEGHGGDFTKAISIYILGEQLVYYFWVAYAPPNNGDALPVNEYDKIIAHLLESFTADPKPLAGWYPVEQSS